jgi:Leucine-rich repeat (LRR) protein
MTFFRRGLLLQSFNMTELGPFLSNMANLEYIELDSIAISSFPSWLGETPNLMYLRLVNPSPNLTELSNLDALPNLEYFIMQRTMIDHLPDTILQQSVLLRYLDLSCNELTTIPEHVFDHFTQLQGLVLGGNQITTLGLQTFASLMQLQVLDLKQPDSTADYASYGSPSFYSFTEMDFSAFAKTCSVNVPMSLQGLQNAHIVNNQQLQRLELANNDELIIPENLFSGLEPILETLDLAGMGLTNVNGFHLDQLCQLRNMRVASNNFSTEEDWLSYQIAINLQKMQYFYVDTANISYASAPLYVLSRFDETMQAFISTAVEAEPISTNPCEDAVWGSLLRNRQWSMPEGDTQCVNRFLALQTEALSWYNLKKDLAYAPCRAFVKAAQQPTVMPLFAFATLALCAALL